MSLSCLFVTVNPASRPLSFADRILRPLWAKLRLPPALHANLTARVTHIYVMTFLGALLLVESAMFFIPGTPLIVHISNVVFIGCLLLLLLLLRVGRTTLSALLLIGCGLMVIILDNITNERPLTTTNLIGFSLVTGSFLALNRKGLVLSAVGSMIALVIGLLAWEFRVRTVTDERWLWQNFIGYAVSLSSTSVIAYIMIGHLRRARVRAEQTDQRLMEQNLVLTREIAERQQAELREQRRSELLREAMEAVSELVSVDDLDLFWRRSVELARERLKIERCGIFVRKEDTNDVWGTFGTDMQGRTTDEHNLFSPEMTEIWVTELSTQHSQRPWRLVKKAAESSSGANGSGWQVYTRIAFYDELPLAIMSNDADLSGAPLDAGQQEVLAVYCSLIGHLVERKRLEGKIRQQLTDQAALAERHRLARDLHDSVSQALFGVVMGANTARQMLDKAMAAQGLTPAAPWVAQMAQPLDYISQLSQAALAELRALIFELRPESLDQDGLLTALHKQASALTLRHRLAVKLDLGSEEPAIDFSSKEALYRIGIEALQNIIKHAQATQVDIVLRTTATELKLELRDNGIGFDSSAIYPGHFGLTSMRERAEAVKGTLAITSHPGGGSVVRVTLPLQVTYKTGRRAKSGTMREPHESRTFTARTRGASLRR